MRILLKTTVALAALIAAPLTAEMPAAEKVQSAASDKAPKYAPPEIANTGEQVWPFEATDLTVDPSYRLYVLPNGMKVALRENGTPEGTALVRLHFDSGSLDETDSEQGLAHFVEHMAFNGSTNVPEGEMIKLLEREGLAFGADTNASTGLEATTYKLNLPRNDTELLDTVLIIMRETASELTISEEAVERERGVILAERRDRRNFAYRNLEDSLEFATPGARYADRLPIGTLEILKNATAADLRGFYERTYVPANATLVIAGDFAVEAMQQAVRKHFSSWKNAAAAPADPVTGPIDIERRSETDIYTDPALSETVQIWRYAPWVDRPDNIANRQAAMQRSIGYGIINRRLAKLARGADAPFRSAGFGVSSVFEDARQTTLTVNSADGTWETGMTAATLELRKAMAFGFSAAEVAEQIARRRSGLEAAARAADTRSNGAFVGGALALVENDRIPTTPKSALERFESYAGSITPESALAAITADATPLYDPLIRFSGRTAPEGGAKTLRSAWDTVRAMPITKPEFAEAAEFGYTDFGMPSEIVSDTRDEKLGFRYIRFANNLRLTLKKTDIREDQIRFRLGIDGGQLLDTKEAPLTTALVSSLSAGGLGKHSQDELATILAGKRVSASIGSSADRFTMGGSTIPQDLMLQMQLLAAALTDPGYRKEGEERYGRSIDNFFANMDGTPGRALGNALGGILSDDDPRFTLQSEEAYEARSFAKLKEDIGGRLANGAMELALVGDLDEDAAISAVASTLGALPMREDEFLPRTEARERSFTEDRSQRIVEHSGEPDQAVIRMIWPTTDDSDLAENIRLNLLARVVRLKLQEQLREDLGKAYSPSAGSSTSRIYPGYGTFGLTASIDVAELEPTRTAIASMLTNLLNEPLDEDTLNRARQPALEAYDNALKSLGGWMGLADRAQSETERLGRFFAAPDIIKGLTVDDMQAAAKKYLPAAKAVEILVLPKEAEQEADSNTPDAPAIMGG
ncbi:MAG: insulinase family protein [Marinomonas sp.]